MWLPALLLVPLLAPGSRLPGAMVFAFISAAVFHTALRADRRRRLVVLGALHLPLAFSTTLVWSEGPVLRFVAALHAAMLMVKLYDLHVGAAYGSVPSLGRTLLFLMDGFRFVERRVGPEADRHIQPRHLLQAAASLGVAAIALWYVSRIDWRDHPFLLEHTAKVLPLCFAMFSALALAIALCRLAGARILDFSHNPWIARTPAEFWRRYNLVLGQFFHEDVFRTAGGRRAPVRATLVTFAVSGVLHEALFTLAIGRIQGYQLAFFLLQGAAVAATLRLRPRGWKGVIGVAMTLSFNVVSSVLFFASAHALLPVYQRGLPDWLTAWQP